MTLTAIASATSITIAPGNNDEDGALFDETAGSYRLLRTRTEEMIADLIFSTLKEDLRGYLKLGHWASVSSHGSDLLASPELLPALGSLAGYFEFLSRALARNVVRRVLRTVLGRMQEYLWEYVLLRNTFSEAGGRQWERDVEELVGVGTRWGDAGRGVVKLCEAGVLLRMGMEELGKVRGALWAGGEGAKGALESVGIVVLGVREGRDVVGRRLEGLEG
jgi:hypothetical protein